MQGLLLHARLEGVSIISRAYSWVQCLSTPPTRYIVTAPLLAGSGANLQSLTEAGATMAVLIIQSPDVKSYQLRVWHRREAGVCSPVNLWGGRVTQFWRAIFGG